MENTNFKTAKSILNKLNSNGDDMFLLNLYERWLNEKDFEDFEDYKTAIQKRITNLEIIKFTKRPFGFNIKIDGETLGIFVKRNGNNIGIACKFI